MDEKEAALEFLAEYEALVKKHRFIVHSCGCCGSPWVYMADPEDDPSGTHLQEHLDHLTTNIVQENS